MWSETISVLDNMLALNSFFNFPSLRNAEIRRCFFQQLILNVWAESERRRKTFPVQFLAERRVLTSSRAHGSRGTGLHSGYRADLRPGPRPPAASAQTQTHVRSLSIKRYTYCTHITHHNHDWVFTAESTQSEFLQPWIIQELVCQSSRRYCTCSVTSVQMRCI